MRRMIMMLFFLVFLVVGIVAIAKYRAYLLDDLGTSSNGSASREALLAELAAHDAANGATVAGLSARG